MSDCRDSRINHQSSRILRGELKNNCEFGTRNQRYVDVGKCYKLSQLYVMLATAVTSLVRDLEEL
jgi:hypothetical protein